MHTHARILERYSTSWHGDGSTVREQTGTTSTVGDELRLAHAWNIRAPTCTHMPPQRHATMQRGNRPRLLTTNQSYCDTIPLGMHMATVKHHDPRRKTETARRPRIRVREMGRKWTQACERPRRKRPVL